MNALIQAREKKGYTQEQFAKSLEVATSTYNMYEKGNRSVPAAIATKISEILETPIEQIFLPIRFTISKTNARLILNSYPENRKGGCDE